MALPDQRTTSQPPGSHRTTTVVRPQHHAPIWLPWRSGNTDRLLKSFSLRWCDQVVHIGTELVLNQGHVLAIVLSFSSLAIDPHRALSRMVWRPKCLPHNDSGGLSGFIP